MLVITINSAIESPLTSLGSFITLPMVYLLPSAGVSGLSAWPLSKLMISLKALFVVSNCPAGRSSWPTYLRYILNGRDSFGILKVNAS